MTSLNYLRYVAYALFAIGLINLRYQSGESDVVLRTLVIVGTGILIFGLTYLKAGKKLLSHSMGRALAWIVAIAATFFAILN